MYVRTHTHRLIICIESYAQTVIQKVNKFPKNKQRSGSARRIREVERKTATAAAAAAEKN